MVSSLQGGVGFVFCLLSALESSLQALQEKLQESENALLESQQMVLDQQEELEQLRSTKVQLLQMQVDFDTLQASYDALQISSTVQSAMSEFFSAVSIEEQAQKDVMVCLLAFTHSLSLFVCVLLRRSFVKLAVFSLGCKGILLPRVEAELCKNAFFSWCPPQQAELDDWNEFAMDLEAKQEETRQIAFLLTERDSQVAQLEQELREMKTIHVGSRFF